MHRFEVPEPILTAWRAVGLRGQAMRDAWNNSLSALPSEARASFQSAMTGSLPKGWESTITEIKKDGGL